MRVSPLVGLTLGGTFTASGMAMLVCAVVGFAEGEAGPAFAVPGAVTTLLGLVLLKTGLDPDRRSIAVTPVGGLLAVTMAWTLASATGVAPLLASGAFDSPLDAFFESVSGFTTTGASILNDIEALPHGVLLWRSMTHWMGGMGIIVLVVAVLPFLGVGGMQLFRKPFLARKIFLIHSLLPLRISRQPYRMA